MLFWRIKQCFLKFFLFSVYRAIRALRKDQGRIVSIIIFFATFLRLPYIPTPTLLLQRLTSEVWLPDQLNFKTSRPAGSLLFHMFVVSCKSPFDFLSYHICCWSNPGNSEFCISLITFPANLSSFLSLSPVSNSTN